MKTSYCPYPSMSSCAVSCYTYCPEASSVFATLVSSPTADVPPFCRFAFNYWEQQSQHRLKRKPLLPRNRAHFGPVPNARPHGGHRSRRNVVSKKYVVAAAVGVVEIVNRRFKELWEKRPLLFPQLRQFPQRFSAPAFALRC